MLSRAIGLLRTQGLPGLLILAILLLPLLWVWPQRGVTARYHDNTDWARDPVAVRIEPRLTLEAVEQRGTTLPQHQFGVLMDGWLRIDRTGEYEFSTRSDDGSTLDVADQRVVDNGGYHAPRTASGTIRLDRGFHPLRLRYIQGGGAYTLEVLWSEPGGEESAIPMDRFYVEPPATPGLRLLTANAMRLWGLAWLGLLGALARRAITRTGGLTRAGLRTIGLKAAVVAASILFTLVLAESAIRLGSYVLEDRRDLRLRLGDSGDTDAGSTRVYSLGDIVQSSEFEGIVYELKPNLRGYFVAEPLAINSRGLRDREHSYRKDEDTVRIVGLGDSALFGWGVSQEEDSLALLERKLNDAASSTTFEVINFSAPGYNTAIEAEVFIRKCLDYDPDIVLVNFNTNDYDVPGFMKLPKDYATVRTSYLFDFVYSRYQALTGVRLRELPVFDFTTRTLSLEEAARLDEDPGLPAEYRSMVGTRGFERAVDALIDAAREADVEVVFFDVKGYPGLHPTYAPNEFRDSQRELLERFSQEKGFHWLNTYPRYVDYLNANPDAPFPLVFAVSDTDSHPSALAHRINAEALYDFLIGRGLIELD